MSRAGFTIVVTAATFSLVVCCCMAANKVEDCVTGEVEIQWPGGGGMGGGCGGDEGGGCDCGGGQSGGLGGDCGGGEGDGCDCGGDDGGGPGSGVKYAYVSIIAHQNTSSGEASGILRHWVTNESIDNGENSETEEVSSEDSSEDTSDSGNLHREIVVVITHLVLVGEGAHARLIGQCIYDSKAMKNQTGRWLLADVVDGGTPAREGDTLAWKWFSEAPLTKLEDPVVSLNPKEILGGNLVIHR